MMLLKKIPLLNEILENLNNISSHLKKEKIIAEELKNQIENSSEEIEKIKSSISQKDILLINLFKEVENLKNDKQMLEKDLLSLVSAIGSLHVIIENFILEEYDEESYKKKFKYH